MCIFFDDQGNAIWHYYRNSYRKARWRKTGQRLLARAMKCGKSGLLFVV